MDLRNSVFHSMFFLRMLFNLAKLVYVPYFVPLILFTSIIDSKIFEADLFFIIMFLWRQSHYTLIRTGDYNANNISGDVQGNQNHGF